MRTGKPNPVCAETSLFFRQVCHIDIRIADVFDGFVCAATSGSGTWGEVFWKAPCDVRVMHVQLFSGVQLARKRLERALGSVGLLNYGLLCSSKSPELMSDDSAGEQLTRGQLEFLEHWIQAHCQTMVFCVQAKALERCLRV